jgi:hypothetical protein
MTPDQFHALAMTTGLSAQDYKERDETIIRMRVEEKKTLDQIARPVWTSPRENKTNHSQG